jgi:hypothetical protein
MKFSAIPLILSFVVAAPALGGPGDPRLLQGKLEWPTALSGSEPFIVLRGDDGRVYYADVVGAQRYVQGALSAGSQIALLGLEGTKPHEVVAVALGSGDTAALSLAIAQSPPTTSLTAASPPSPTPPGVPPSSSGAAPAAATPPARREEGRPSPGDEGRWVTVRGSVYGIAGQNLFIKKDDGRVVMVDIAKLDPATAQRLKPGSSVAIVVVPVGNKFQATGLMETEPTKPSR